MPVNSYFNQSTFATEQGLIQDLIDESIAIFGHSVRYLPRESVNIDALFGEDQLQLFNQAREIEMYLKSSTSFEGQSEFISKFGLTIEDQCTFVVSVRRFSQALGDLLIRPFEGDLIWIQLGATNTYLFEIRFVENKEQLFQLGSLYTYELRCEMMNYSHERVQTGNTAIDSVAQSEAYTLAFTMVGGNTSYTIGETVYQGGDPLDAVATGTVYTYANNVLQLQNITGTFVDSLPIIGMTSGVSYAIANTSVLDIAPTIHDPLSENDFNDAQANSIIVVRGTNPAKS